MPRPPATPRANPSPADPSPANLLLCVLAAATLAVAVPAAAAEEAPAAAAAPEWHTRLEPALAAARAQGKPILVDLFAEWCGWCHKLEDETFSSPRFADFARDFVLLRVDVEDGGEGGWLRRRLGVFNLPTLAIVDADLVRMGLVDGYAPTDLYLMRIARTLAAYEVIDERDAKRMESDDEATLRAVGRDLLARQDGAAAARVYEKLLARPKLTVAERVEFLLWRADAERLTRRYDVAAATLAEARGALGDGGAANPKLHDALDLGVLRLAEDRGGCPGVEVLEEFVRDRAESRHVTRARNEIAELKAGPAKSCS